MRVPKRKHKRRNKSGTLYKRTVHNATHTYTQQQQHTESKGLHWLHDEKWNEYYNSTKMMKIAETFNRRELRDTNTINNVNEPIAIQNKSITSAYSQKNARAYTHAFEHIFSEFVALNNLMNLSIVFTALHTFRQFQWFSQLHLKCNRIPVARDQYLHLIF